MSNAPSEVRGTPEFHDFFLNLKKGTYIQKVIQNGIDKLWENMFAGDKVGKNKWPRYYVKKYEIRNLFVLDISKGWRLTYTIIAEGMKKIVCILEAMDHKTYEKRFGY